MQFYVMREPDYSGEWKRWKPTNHDIEALPIRLPAVDCAACGNRWSTNARLPLVQLPESREMFTALSRVECLRTGEFKDLVKTVREEFHIPDEISLPPGISFGPATISFRRTTNLPDFVWDWSGVLLVSPKAQQALKRFGVIGYTLAKVNAVIPADEEPGDAPGYAELIISGNAGRAIVNPEFVPVVTCSECGFQKFGKLTFLRVSEDAWDCSHICHFIGQPRHRLATELTKAAVEQAELTNLSLLPLDILYPGP